MHLSGLPAALRRGRLLVVLVAGLAGLTGFGLALRQTPEYEATSRLFLADPRQVAMLQGEVLEPVAEGYAEQQAALIGSTPVLEEAAALLDGVLPAEDLRDRLSAAGAGERSLVISVTARAPEAQEAATIATAAARAYEQVAARLTEERVDAALAGLAAVRQELEQRAAQAQQQAAGDPGSAALQSQAEALDQQLLRFETRVQRLRMDAGLVASGVQIIEEAPVPSAPSRPKPLRDGAAAAALGFVLAVCAVLLRAARSRRVASREDPARVLAAPLLGDIPRFAVTGDDPLAAHLTADDLIAESYQFVLAAIEYALAEQGGSSLLVTSATAGEGRTTTALQLAIAATRDGRRVVLVDSDIRVQGLTRLLGVEDRTGLTELALRSLPVDESVHYLPVTDELLLPVVTAGGPIPDAAAFLRTEDLRAAVRRIGDEADLVIIDASPLLAVADTSILAGNVDGVVLVVNHGTDLAQLAHVRERLAFVPTPLLGYVYNRCEHPSLVIDDLGPEPTAHGARRPSPSARPPAAARGRSPTRTAGAASAGAKDRTR